MDSDYSPTYTVDLFSWHANELRKVRRHLFNKPTVTRTQGAGGRQRKAQPPLSDERVGQVIAAYKLGKTVYELAAEYNCHRVTISAVLKWQGVALRRTSPTPEQIEEMVCLYEDGYSLARVGDRLGVSATTVFSRLRERVIVTRDPHGNKVDAQARDCSVS
jgi:DNA invertase Pin-like site-specific DNA recombinase